MRLFIYDLDEHCEVLDYVVRVKITRKNKKQVLIINQYLMENEDTRLLSEIKLAFMVDIKSKDCKEYFRYEK